MQRDRLAPYNTVNLLLYIFGFVEAVDVSFVYSGREFYLKGVAMRHAVH